MSRFKGIAYWEISDRRPEWFRQAKQLLAPLEEAGIATLTTEGIGLSVRFGEDQYSMHQDVACGVVPDYCTAPMFIVCLMALRKILGGMVIVDDATQSIPRTPRQDHPIFASCWDQILPVAQALGLMPSAAFLESIGANSFF
jgi:hypothetical protein